MKVFISWSGERSKQVALALRAWLPQVVKVVQPYMSDRDNHAGMRWADKLSDELEAANFGIVCVTPENLNSRWLNFEAGAISKAVDKARVAPVLYGLSNPSELPPPLGLPSKDC
jgi:TIR domain